jgi:D-sedoheptulose 7-phosphate isomerase
MNREEIIKSDFTEAQKILNDFISEKKNIKSISDAAELMIKAIKGGGKIISCGNGGSMCDAMHFAEEMTGRFRNDRTALPAISISDPSHISCVANDYGFEFIFSRFIEAHGKKGDVLLAISTSGNSKNILNAISAAKKLGVSVVGLTGKSGGQMVSECDVVINSGDSKYADRIQEIHIKVIHALIYCVEEGL